MTDQEKNQQLLLQKISERALNVVKNMFLPNPSHILQIKDQTSQQSQKFDGRIFDASFLQRSAKKKLQIFQINLQQRKQTEKYMGSFLLSKKTKIRSIYKKKIPFESQTTAKLKDNSQIFTILSNKYKQFKHINLGKIEGSHINFPKLQKRQISLPPVKRQPEQSKSTVPFDHSLSIDYGFRSLNNISVTSFANQTEISMPNLGSKQQIKSITKPMSQIGRKKENASLFLSPQTKKKISNNQQLESVKSIQYPLSKKFEKGYMYYDQQGMQFFQINKHNIQLTQKITGNIMVSAKYYIAINTQNLKCISSRKKSEQIEIASLTKIMTCYLCILACIKYEVNIKTHTVRVSDKVIDIPGTSACLEPGDLFTIQQLLYGLMLPSGNDSSLVIAETIGKIIQRHKKKPTKKTPYETFIAHMNLLAQQLSLNQEYQNSSGLSLNPNFSSPVDIAVLTCIALRNPTFRLIINTKQYSIDVKNDRFGLNRKITWTNTNRLLWKGWEGVKTGTTQSAGHCLASLKNNHLICVFDCQTLSKRFTQCCKIFEQIQKRHQKTTSKQ